MIVLLSPSKTQDFSVSPRTKVATTPLFWQQACELAAHLRRMDADEIASLMKIGASLAEATAERYAHWSDTEPASGDGSLQAGYAYTGEVFRGLNFGDFSAAEAKYAHERLYVISGLYGLARPLDRIRPYRLEMKTPITFGTVTSLYEFWGTVPTDALNRAINRTRSTTVVNLASQESWRVVQPDRLAARVVTPQFREAHAGGYRTVAIHAKRARGSMAAWILRNHITSPHQLADYTHDGYTLHETISTSDMPVFTRGDR
ncbi:MAG: YaaA family protein [Spirochaetaceae bacterium]|nr:MAG: YaaA family protein [Spirochaetaceae bacterium]